MKGTGSTGPYLGREFDAYKEIKEGDWRGGWGWGRLLSWACLLVTFRYLLWPQKCYLGDLPPMWWFLLLLITPNANYAIRHPRVIVPLPHNSGFTAPVCSLNQKWSDSMFGGLCFLPHLLSSEEARPVLSSPKSSSSFSFTFAFLQGKNSYFSWKKNIQMKVLNLKWLCSS